MTKQIVKWMLITILVISLISFVIVFQLNYTADALMARAIPIAIIVGFSSVAVSIMFKE